MVEPGHVDGGALWICQQVDAMPHPREGLHHGQDGEGRSPHLEEGLRSEKEDVQWLRNRSASMAAMQPLPAAVTACR